VVKGLSRQVIVVDSPDPDLFEQAIFVVRKEITDRACVTQERLLREACRVAQGYCRTRRTRKAQWGAGRTWLWSIIGVGGVLLGWAIHAIIAI